MLNGMDFTPRLCACGCGQHAKVDRRRNRVSTFLPGHNGARRGQTQSAETRAKLAAYTGSRTSSYKHGWSNTPTHRTWTAMHSRCRDPRNASFPRYGAKGVTVCDRWLDFLNFLADMGARPGLDWSIDRIDGTGNYEPSNCRWATRAQQNANQADPGGWKTRRARQAGH